MKTRKVEGGAVFIARQLLDSGIWSKPSTWLKIWLYILCSVNYKDNKQYKRGTGFFSWPSILTTRQNWSDIKLHTVDNCVRWLKLTGQITTQKTTRGMIISVCNYALYQDIKTYKNDTENDKVYVSLTGQERDTNDTITVIKEIKKESNNNTNVLQKVAYGSPDINEALAYMKEKLGLPVLDDSLQVNRNYTNLLLKKFGGIEKVKLLIDATATHDFWSTRITSMKTLYYKGVNIISSGRDVKNSVTKL